MGQRKMYAEKEKGGNSQDRLYDTLKIFGGHSEKFDEIGGCRIFNSFVKILQISGLKHTTVSRHLCL